MYDEHGAMKMAVAAGQQSPCAKSKRGVVLWKRDSGVWPLHIGFNHPPSPMMCDGSEACRAACNKVCVHAEEDAILNAVNGVREYEMLHVKVVDGNPVPSGPPSCWQCSRMILKVGIKRMWLLHEEGLRGYSATEFHRLTLEHCGLPVISVLMGTV